MGEAPTVERNAPSITEKQLRARELAWIHVLSEPKDIIPDIVNTLAPEGPYAYTLRCDQPLGTEVPPLTVVPTREEIRDAYTELHKITVIQTWEPFTEIVNDWYAFNHGVATLRLNATGELFEAESVVMFPSLGRDGITGELFWARSTPGPDVASQKGLYGVRRRLRADHDRYLDALRAGDAAAIAEMAVEDAQTSIRDYVADIGTVHSLHTRRELQAYHRAFFERYRVRSLEILKRHADDWFIFAELAWEVEAVAGPRKGQVLRFRTADYAEIGPDFQVRTRVGHGTDLEPVR